MLTFFRSPKQGGHVLLHIKLFSLYVKNKLVNLGVKNKEEKCNKGCRSAAYHKLVQFFAVYTISCKNFINSIFRQC